VLQRARDDRRRAVNPDDVIDAGDAAVEDVVLPSNGITVT
jgi:hypothetical protein